MFQVHTLVPEFWCSNFEDSLHFYTEVVGFSVAQRRGNDLHAYLELGNAQIMIACWKRDGTWEPAPLEKPYGRGVNFQILTDDIQSIYLSALSADVKPFVELHTSWYWRTDRMEEWTEFGLLDPDGYLLRFTEVGSHRSIEQSDMDTLDEKRGAMPL
jgi:catechol 2,3-dioxygenase-like lactoylglutathione lyase family enzyme